MQGGRGHTVGSAVEQPGRLSGSYLGARSVELVTVDHLPGAADQAGRRRLGRPVTKGETRAHRGGRVDDVVLASATAGEFAHPCGCGRGHVIDVFAACDEPLREVAQQIEFLIKSREFVNRFGLPPHDAKGS